MIKLSFCLVRLPSLTREAFQAYWLGTHAPLVASVAELWFDSLDAMAANGARPQAQAAAALLLEDERRFIDLPKSPLWFSQEHVIVG
jgi:hypothetical protein